MPRPKPTPARKASGENIEEWQRHGCKVQFRLGEVDAMRLEDRAAELGMTPNSYAQMLVRRDLYVPGEETDEEASENARADAAHDRR